MSQVMQFEFRLFGPRKGQTIMLNGHQFVDGLCTLVQSSDNMGNAARVFSFYGAYARGTPEYDAAVALEEAENGADEVSEASIEGANSPVPTGVQSDGGGSSEAGTPLTAEQVASPVGPIAPVAIPVGTDTRTPGFPSSRKQRITGQRSRRPR
jgi:hypothetical protein